MSLGTLQNSELIVEPDSADAILLCNGGANGPWNLNFIINFIKFAMSNDHARC